MLKLARDAAVVAERLATCKEELHQVSTDTARNARQDIVEAIEHLQTFDKPLGDKISSSASRCAFTSSRKAMGWDSNE